MQTQHETKRISTERQRYMSTKGGGLHGVANSQWRDVCCSFRTRASRVRI